MEELISLIQKLGFSKCEYCGRYMWNLTKRFDKYCSTRCLFKASYKEDFNRGKALCKDVDKILDKLEGIRGELKEIMDRYTEGRW